MPLIAMLAVISCLTILLRLGTVGGKTTVTFPSMQPVYIKSGDTLNLICEQSEGFKVFWYKKDQHHQYKEIDSNRESGIYFTNEVVGKRVLKLIKENVTLNDEGSYRCAALSGTDPPYSVDVFVLQVEDRKGLVTHSGNTTTLSCIVSSVEKVSVTAIWSKNNKTLDMKTPTNKYNSSIAKNGNMTELMLSVKNVGEIDVGDYQCHINLPNGNNFTHTVSLESYPQVKQMERSRNLMAGLTLELTCKAWGWPAPNITWDFDEGKPLNRSDNRITDFQNGTLRIENIAASDRAVYVCTASSSIGSARQNSSTRILVRVKGKLAMLWPLLGIALEVIILSCIIYIYERNRVRQRAEQERKEAADHQSNSNAQHHQGRDSVRYRK